MDGQDGALETVDTTLDLGDNNTEDTTTDGQDQNTEGDGSGADGDGSSGVSNEPLTAAELWKQVKAVDSLDANVRRQIQNAIHKAERLEGKFPDGADKAAEHLAAVAKLADQPGMPIERVLEETLQERQYFRELDGLFTKGDAGFITKMAEASPESFQAIMPAAFTKLAELNPAGFAALITEPIVQSMDKAGLTTEFQMLAHLLPQLEKTPQTERIIAAIENIFGWTQQMRGHAAKGYAAPKIEAKPGQTQQTEQTAEELRIENYRLKWNSAIGTEGPSMIRTEYSRLAAGKVKLTEAEQKKIRSKASEEVDARLSANTGYQKDMQGFLKQGNQSAYTTRIRSEYKKLIPGATKRAYDDVVAERKTQKPAANGKPTQKQPQQQQTSKQATAGTQGSQFERISGAPATLKLPIDWARTTNKMMVNRQAFIKGREKPVTWATK